MAAVPYDNKTDLGLLFEEQKRQGNQDYDAMKKIADDRLQKAQSSPQYNQYINDDVQKSMNEYLESIKPKQNPIYTPPDYSAYIEEMNRAAKEKALAELRSAYEKNVAGVDRAKQGIAPQYESARNQAAGQSELQKRQFAEYAAANGLNSGAGGQAQLAQSAALQQGLNQINTAESSAMADLELQRSQMEIEYNNAIAQANATGDYQLAQQLYQEKVRQDEALRQQIQWQAQQDLSNQQFQFQQEQAGIGNSQWNQQFQNNQEQQKWGNMLDMAKQLAAYGDFSGYEALGYDTTQMKAEWEAEKQRQLAANQAKPSGSGTKKPSMSFANMQTAIENGQITPGVKEAYEYYMKEPWPYEQETPDAGGSGMNEAYFGTFARSLATQMESGKTDTLVSGLDGAWPKLSPAQRKQIQELLGRYGYQYNG